jgi:hypothetical protein
MDEKAFYSLAGSGSQSPGIDRYSVGHSWGGYAALVSGMPEYKVKKIVSISGFNSVSDEYRVIPLKRLIRQSDDCLIPSSICGTP